MTKQEISELLLNVASEYEEVLRKRGLKVKYDYDPETNKMSFDIMDEPICHTDEDFSLSLTPYCSSKDPETNLTAQFQIIYNPSVFDDIWHLDNAFVRVKAIGVLPGNEHFSILLKPLKVVSVVPLDSFSGFLILKY